MTWRSGCWLLFVAYCSISCSHQRPEPWQPVIKGPLASVDFLIDEQSVFDVVPDLPKTGETTQVAELDEARAIYDFIRHQIEPYALRTDLPLPAFLYGYGAGMCGEQSRLMVVLWNDRKLDARIHALPRHTLAEVRADEGWHLFDAQHHLDYSAIHGAPYNLESLRASDEPTRQDLDPIGYSWQHMYHVLSEEGRTLDVSGLTMPRPAISLEEGQSLTIRPRQSNEPLQLPFLEVPQAYDRTDIIAMYFVEFRQTLQAGQTSPIRIGLPLLKINAPETVRFSPEVGNAGQADRSTLLNQIQPLQATTDQDADIVLTFALAGWVGDRLFSAKSFSVPEYKTFRPKAFETKVWFETSELPADIDSNDKVDLEVTIHWQHLYSHQPESFTVHWERLVSGLPLESAKIIDSQSWLWLPEKHEENGYVTLKTTIEVDPNLPQPYRPSGHYSYQARIIAPHLPAGKNHAAWHFKTKIASMAENAASE